MDVWFDSGSTWAAVAATSAPKVPRRRLSGGRRPVPGLVPVLYAHLHRRERRGALPADRHPRLDGGRRGQGYAQVPGQRRLPEEVIKDYGADMLRLWVSSADYTQDMRISPEILKQLSEAYLKIRNTARYMLGNLAGFWRGTSPAPN